MCRKDTFLATFALLSMLILPFNIAAKEGFVLQDMAGKTHRLSQYTGKWVVVNYWATWCPPCLEEIPDLVSIYDARKDSDVMVLGVVFDYEGTEAVEAYVDDMLVSYPIILGTEGVAQQIGDAAVLPTTFIFNPKGRLVKTKRGVVTQHYLNTLFANRQLAN